MTNGMETVKRTKKTRIEDVIPAKWWGWIILAVAFTVIALVATPYLINPAAEKAAELTTSQEAESAVSAGESNTPLVANATETPTLTVIAIETPESKPTDSSESNVVFVTPTPRPEPKVYPLNIQVELSGMYGATADSKDVSVNIFLKDKDLRNKWIKGDIKYLGTEDKWICLSITRYDGSGKTFLGKNKLPFEYRLNHIETIDEVKENYRISVVLSNNPLN